LFFSLRPVFHSLPSRDSITKHPFHIVSPSPWPLLCSFSATLILFGLAYSFSSSSFSFFFLGATSLFFCSTFWWSSIVRESTFLGCHTRLVQSGLRLGMFLFIISEVFFFFAFFWAYLHRSLSPSVEIGSLWPPMGISSLDPFTIPLLNTFLLLSSGATVTWSHSSLISGRPTISVHALFITIILGFSFGGLQSIEYFYCSFTISDSVFGSCFYLATGFHGAHVFFGSLFLVINLFRLLCLHFTPSRHLGFEFAIWYWHFVDVVWILLFIIVYCWGSV